MENLGTGLKTVDPCSGQEATSLPAIIPTLDSPTTSRPEAIQLSINQSSEEDLAQVEEIVQKYELESGQSLTVKGNLKKNLGFWRSIGAPNFILTIIEKGYKLPFASLPLAVRLKKISQPDCMLISLTELFLSLLIQVGFVGLISNLLLLTPYQYLFSHVAKRG